MRSLLIVLLGFALGQSFSAPWNEHAFDAPVFFDTVPLGGDYGVRVYRSTGSLKHYFAPLALLEHTSAAASKNALTGEHQIAFRVEMWNDELEQLVDDHLSKNSGKSLLPYGLGVMPFERVSLRCRHCAACRPDSNWRSFATSPKKMEFRLVCPSDDASAYLADQMTKAPQHFASQLTLHYRLERSPADATRKINVSLAADHIWDGRVMTDLNRQFSQGSFAYVTYADRSKIVSETLANVLSNIDSAGSKEWIVDPVDESRLRRLIENQLFERVTIEMDDEHADDMWNSIYWNFDDNVLQIKPDALARKLNKIYNKANDDEEKWIARLAENIPEKRPAKGVRPEVAQAIAAAVGASSQLSIAENFGNVRQLLAWTDGLGFSPRFLKLYKISLDRLRNDFQPTLNVGVKLSVVDMSLDLQAEPTMNQMNFNRMPEIPDSVMRNAKSMESAKTSEADAKSTPATKDSTKKAPGATKRISGLFQTIRGAITGGGIETAPYTVLRTEKDYEERLYPARKWVKTQLKHMSRDAASSVMFWKLFNYISGQNDKQVKIPMTAPVSVLIEPGAGPNCESTFTMAFYIPAAFEEETPVPTDPEVSIEQRPEFTTFVRTYGGFTNDRVTQQEHNNLYASLSEDDKALVDPNGTYFYAGYDPPFKLFYRRNEIWMFHKAEGELASQRMETTSGAQQTECTTST